MYIKPETTIKQTSVRASLLAGSNCYCDPHPHHHGGHDHGHHGGHGGHHSGGGHHGWF